MTLTLYKKICLTVALALGASVARTYAQTGIVASDTLRINGQTGSLNLLTGAGNRTLNFPAQSGTLALESSGAGSGQCCPTDTSILFSYVFQNAANTTIVSDVIDVGQYSKELVAVIGFGYPGNVVGAGGSVRIETAAELVSGWWWPVIDYAHNVAIGQPTMNIIVRPSQEYYASSIPAQNINTKVYMHGWLKYIRVVGQLGGGGIGRYFVVGLTVR